MATKGSSNRSILPNDILMTVMSWMEWEDLKMYFVDKLFDIFHPVLSSKSFLLSLCQRDFYSSKFDDLSNLSIPTQIYIHSRIIAQLKDHSLSKFACCCGPYSNPILSKVICFEELINIFIIEQCYEHGYRSKNSNRSDAMKNAFINSKAVRIGITKTILSHPLCVLWEYNNLYNPGYRHEYYIIHSKNQILNDWTYDESIKPYKFLMKYNMDTFNTYLQNISYLWRIRRCYGGYDDNDVCLIFMDNMDDSSGKCGIFAVEIQYETNCAPGKIIYDNALTFDENTSLDEFKGLYRKSLTDFFNFPYSFWPKFHIEECLGCTDEYIVATLKYMDIKVHCFEYFYPLLNSSKIETTPWKYNEYKMFAELQELLFMKYQKMIRKYTNKITKYVNEKAFDHDKCIEILDGMRYRINDEMINKKSRILTQAIERCMRRIINAILFPYLKHFHFYIPDWRLIKILKGREDLKKMIENNGIGMDNAMPSCWPNLFLMMGLKWIPIIYQCIKYDLQSIDQVRTKMNVIKFNKKLEAFGLKFIANEKASWICDYLHLCRF